MVEAIKCKHCGEWLEAPALAPAAVELGDIRGSHEESALQAAAAKAISTRTPAASLFWSWLVATWLLESMLMQALLHAQEPRSFLWIAFALTAFNAAAATGLTFKIRYSALPAEPARIERMTIWGLAWRVVVSSIAGSLVRAAFEFLAEMTTVLLRAPWATS